MLQIWTSIALAANLALAAQPVPVQFARSMAGRTVAVCVDGQEVKMTTAGKLGFRDRTSTWTSVCAEVRNPVAPGQMYRVRPIKTSLAGGTIALAGNIVARHFKEAQSADQCAALQLAVWEAVEDGGRHANFAGGAFQARSTRVVIAMAEQYYEAIELPGEALYLESGQDGGQGQILPS